jgi:hypothetical protein
MQEWSVRAFIVSLTAYLITHGLFSEEFLEKYRYLVVSQSLMRVLLLLFFLDSLLEQERNTKNIGKRQEKRVPLAGNFC